MLFSRSVIMKQGIHKLWRLLLLTRFSPRLYQTRSLWTFYYYFKLAICIDRYFDNCSFLKALKICKCRYDIVRFKWYKPEKNIVLVSSYLKIEISSTWTNNYTVAKIRWTHSEIWKLQIDLAANILRNNFQFCYLQVSVHKMYDSQLLLWFWLKFVILTRLPDTFGEFHTFLKTKETVLNSSLESWWSRVRNLKICNNTWCYSFIPYIPA